MSDQTMSTQSIPLDRLDPHPANPNRMSDAQIETLAANIEVTGRYQPLIVRPRGDRYQTLNGAQRGAALGQLGRTHASCLVWDVTDEDALLLLASLNSIHGEEVPALRAALIRDLAEHQTLHELALLLPEDEDALTALIDEPDLGVEELLAQFEASAARDARAETQLFSFAVPGDDAATVEAAIDQAVAALRGKNRRGRALALLATAFLESE